ncbi:hypothetical protein C5615_22725 [Burkholderia cepacia]|uniref:HEPN domain-containing protein n=1 Tax=Burkholderia cepacia TaxID=292 RepID=A0A2S8IL47_BURCE|nr:hypothetical protein [Burkholderia cepacia]PQP15494.1 hypothetical protein C5615_22725 [Burkholderia cepacia]HDR9508893.1 hypothetical protein [Burkholderia cepacia]HDR9512650.1 hypothetical protein [Burkholderia cepacia]
MMNPMLPNRKQFAQDPAGYSRSAWMRWAMITSMNGAELDPFKQPTSDDLKNPLLWLTQAEAMSQAAFVLINAQPSFGTVPAEMQGICDSQYCAVALMLVGYSLEVCLKAMIIVKEGVEAYSEAERKYQTHDLKKLATFIADLNTKDLATLELLTHFVVWAGRYPDPGSRYIDKHDNVFDLAEQNQVSGHDLFKLASKVMQHVSTLTDAKR